MKQFKIEATEYGALVKRVVFAATARDAIDDAYGQTEDPDAEVISVNPVISPYNVSQGCGNNGYVPVALRDNMGTLLTKWYYVKSDPADAMYEDFRAKAPQTEAEALALFKGMIRIAKKKGQVHPEW